MAKITVEQGQCLMDIAIQHCGDQAAIFEIARLNGISATSLINPGSVLEIPEPIQPRIVSYLAEKKAVPATSVQAERFANRRGIGFWRIEVDFVVS